MATLESITKTAPSVSGEKTARRGGMSPRARRQTLAFYVFIAPWLIGFVLLTIIPLVAGFLTSLTNYDGLNVFDLKFKGLDNYGRIFSDPDALFSVGRTILWTTLNVPSWIILSLMLALVLNQDIKWRGFFRTLFYLPNIIPVVATVWVWKIFLDANNGLLNAIIRIFYPGLTLRWFSDYALTSLTMISVWGGLGWGMVVFLAGLQGVPDELKEAARIDGANAIQVFFNITLPLLSPILFFMLINALIGSLQSYVMPLLIAGNQGVPPRETYLYMVHVYRQIFIYQRYGYGTAMLWVLSIVLLALSLLVFWSSRYWVHYEVAVEEGEAKT
jgi:ABC-type sugar transport system permease subunit